MIDRMRPRGVAGPVLAMARPPRPGGGRDLVLAGGLRPAVLAARVASLAMAEIDRDLLDAMDAKLADAALGMSEAPIKMLVTCPVVDTASIARAIRLHQFEARGCTHLPESAWPNERRQLERALT